MFESFIISSIRKNIAQSKHNLTHIDYESLKNVLIIYEKFDLERAENLKSQLISDGKNCSFFCFDNSKNKNQINNHPSEYNRNTLNLFGFPKKKVVSEFIYISQNIDLLINVSNFNYLSLSYLASLSEYRLKVGIATDECNVYNLMIEVPKNIDTKFLSQQIMFYLRKLKR